MRAWWASAAAAVVVAACPGATPWADDLVRAPAEAPAPRRPAKEPGIDLESHVDINVVLPPDQWRVGGGLRNVVVAGGGRLVIDGNLTIMGKVAAATPESVRRTDEILLNRLRQAQRDRLQAGVGLPPDKRRALELATEADIRRLLTEVSRLRDRYAGLRANLGDEAWGAFQKEIQVLRRALADPFGAESLSAAVAAGFEGAADD